MRKRITKKQKFIGEYLDRAMANHNLPYGFAYFALLDEKEKEAETEWKKRNKTVPKFKILDDICQSNNDICQR